jgi:hypothetical protein
MRTATGKAGDLEMDFDNPNLCWNPESRHGHDVFAGGKAG